MSAGIWDPRPQEVGDVLKGFERRIRKTEFGQTAPLEPDSHFDGPITVGPWVIDPNTPLPPIGPPSNPTSLTITPGIFRGACFVDIEWGTQANANTIGFDVVIATKTSIDPAPVTWDLPDNYKAAGENIRISGLEPNTVYGVQVRGYSIFGEYSSAFPPAGYQEFTSSVDTTIPSQVTGVSIARGATTAVVQFNPSDDFDVELGKGQYIVQIDSVNTFDSVDFQEKVDTATVVMIAPVIDEDLYYARVAAIDSSGNQGPWSAIAGPVDVGGVNDSMIIADLSAAKITFGEMSGDRIQANSLDAEKIKTSSLTAADILLDGGSIKAGDPDGVAGDGVVYDGNGIRGYKAGNITFNIDADTGDVQFNDVTVTGVFQTATSSRRVIIKEDPTSHIHYMEFWPESAQTPLLPSRIFEWQPNPTFPAKRGLTIQAAAYFYNPGDDSPMLSMYSDGNASPEFSYRSQMDLRADRLDLFAPHLDTLDLQLFNAKINDACIIHNTGGAVTTMAKFGNWATQNNYYNGYGQNWLGNCEVIGNSRVLIANNQTGSLRSFLDLDDIGVDFYSYSSMWIAANGYISIVASICYIDLVGNFIQLGGYVRVNNLNSAPAGNQAAFDTNNELMILTSSRRYKDEIMDLEDDATTPSSDILQLMRPVTYLSTTTEDDEQRYIGLIAEEVDELFPGLTIKDAEGRVQAISWNQIYPLMIAEIQKNRRDIDELKEELHARG